MASYVTPKKNTAFIFYCALEDQANAGLFNAAPTLASGDWKVSIDGGALNNLATLPTVTPTGGRMVKVSLSADEMNGDNITVVASDASGAEWYDVLVNIQTSARQIDDLAATGADSDTLKTLSDQIDATATASALATVDGIVDGLAAVAPDYKPTVAATGEASANVTMWTGDGVNDLTDGKVPANVYQVFASAHQDIADALLLAPAGVAAAGSAMAKLDGAARPGDPMTIARRP